MDKKCTKCGALLAGEAFFCPHCATPQREKVGMMPPRRQKDTLLRWTAAIFVLAAVSLAFLPRGDRAEPMTAKKEPGTTPPSEYVAPSESVAPSASPSPSASVAPTASPSPEVSEAPEASPSPESSEAPSVSPSPVASEAPPEPITRGAEAVWVDGDREYRLALSFYSGNAPEWKTPVEQIEITCHPDFNYMTDSTLYVWDAKTGAGVQQEFEKKLSGIAVTGSAVSGNGVTALQAEKNGSVWKSSIRYNAQSGTGEVCWNLVMKNGDVITLVHRMVVSPYPTVTINGKKEGLYTSADLQAALDALTGEDLEEKFIMINLPGAAYEEPVTLPEGRYEINCIDLDRQPNFAGGLIVSGGEATCTGIRFEGNGGVGVTCDGNFMMYNCTVSGWDTGVLANQGSWAVAHGTTFENNVVGLHFNSGRSNFTNTEYDGNTFTGNGTAMLLERVPLSAPLSFVGTIFSGNGVNFDNRCGKMLDTTYARFEE